MSELELIRPWPDYERWVREIRDPANSAEWETLDYRWGRSSVEIFICRVPSGWAWMCNYWAEEDRVGGASPWLGPFERFAEARDAALVYTYGFMASYDPAKHPDAVHVVTLLEAAADRCGVTL